MSGSIIIKPDFKLAELTADIQRQSFPDLCPDLLFNWSVLDYHYTFNLDVCSQIPSLQGHSF